MCLSVRETINLSYLDYSCCMIINWRQIKCIQVRFALWSYVKQAGVLTLQRTLPRTTFISIRNVLGADLRLRTMTDCVFIDLIVAGLDRGNLLNIHPPRAGLFSCNLSVFRRVNANLNKITFAFAVRVGSWNMLYRGSHLQKINQPPLNTSNILCCRACLPVCSLIICFNGNFFCTLKLWRKFTQLLLSLYPCV